jgi:UTP--glucose-1-phosphate uridylyltransferase
MSEPSSNKLGKKVRKAVVPVAGLGTRFLPATKAVPKEMLPMVDVPSIQIIVEECVAAGIEEVIFVTARGKSAIEDHFDRAPELEALLARRGKKDDLAVVRRLTELARFISVRQGEPRGLGHAVLCARAAVGDEPFAVLLGDDLLDAEVPGIRQLIDVYERTGTGVVGLKEVPVGQEHMYGIIDGERTAPRELRVRKLIEKPAPGTAPSQLAIIGRYLLPPEIFDILAETPPGRGDEIQLTDGLATLCARRGLYGLEMEGRRFDVGDRAGYVVALVHYALRRDDIRDEVRAGIQKLLLEPR